MLEISQSRIWKAIAALALLLITVHVFSTRSTPLQQFPSLDVHDARLNAARPADDLVPCRGPRGVDVVDAAERPEEVVLPGALPQPWSGSYTALGIPQTWSTAAGRYAAYRRLDPDSTEDDTLQWDTVNWASLQDECLSRNAVRFHGAEDVPSHSMRKLRPPLETEVYAEQESRPKVTSGRTAIVIRSWSTYNWTESDLWYIRSLVAETSLTYGGQYSVFLLVDVKENVTNLWSTEAAYMRVLNMAVPAEFRDMTVLFDTSLQMSWYPDVKEYRPIFQIYQPMQIFAYLFPEFDHFWQLEMDTRFTGHAGHLLEAAATFARNEPRKQSTQRATWSFVEGEYGTYADLMHAIDTALHGDDPLYTGLRIPEIVHPIGRRLSPPPSPSPLSDDFQWGVGEEADLLPLSTLMNVTADKNWVFKPFIYNFTLGAATPRLHCAPGMARTSWNLLNAAHEAQRIYGLALPGEATMPSFALWHGLKISLPPWPMYGPMSAQRGPAFMAEWANGDAPSAEYGGEARGMAQYAKQFVSESDPRKNLPFPNIGTTYRFEDAYPGDLWDTWMRGDAEAAEVALGKVPSLVPFDGRLWMPNMILHPVKTNVREDDQSWLFKPGAIPGTELPKGPKSGRGVTG